MSRRRAVIRHRATRVITAVVGLVLFYAPFAVIARVVGVLLPSSPAGVSVSDTHTACLRMPITWALQPWMWPSLGANILSWLPLAILPIAAVALGPMFCGWVCPAGAITEGLSRAMPRRLKFDFAGRVDIVPLRYGFFAGIVLAPFIASNICCAFCNFNQLQNVLSGVFGGLAGTVAVSTMGMLAMAAWVVPLGMFIQGGRGWCLFLCPTGAYQGLAAGLSAKLPFARRVRRAAGGTCSGCGVCAERCTMRAATVEPTGVRIEKHLCISCLDCVDACPGDALEFTRPGR